jgi:hypothetical protein
MHLDEITIVLPELSLNSTSWGCGWCDDMSTKIQHYIKMTSHMLKKGKIVCRQATVEIQYTIHLSINTTSVGLFFKVTQYINTHKGFLLQ